jgi:hypothetical protein
MDLRFVGHRRAWLCEEWPILRKSVGFGAGAEASGSLQERHLALPAGAAIAAGELE